MKKYIRIQEFCQGHNLSETFVFELHDLGVIQIRQVDDLTVFPARDLNRLERLVRLHRDLELNPQGLHAVEHVLNQLESARREIRELRSLLGRWE